MSSMVDCLELVNLRNFIAEKKWQLAVECLRYIFSKNTIEIDQQALIKEVLNIDQPYLKSNANSLMSHLWKLAYDFGKIKIAKDYSRIYLDYLIENKRIPALIQLDSDIKLRGLQKSYVDITLQIDQILGRKKAENVWENHYALHPDYDKENQRNLSNYLLHQSLWTSFDWKLCYEYILRHHYDEEIFLKILGQLNEEKNLELMEKFNLLCNQNKKYRNFGNTKKSKIFLEKNEREEKLSKVAFEYMENPHRVSDIEQSKIIVAIMQMTNLELLERGVELMTSFGLLGLDRVITVLGNKLLNIIIYDIG